MYPVILAHANDHAPPGAFIQVSGGLLMVFGLGSIVGPLVAGVAMTDRSPTLLFAITAAAHLGIVLFALWRMRRRADLPTAEKGDFVATPPARLSTPETVVLAQGEEAQEPEPGDRGTEPAGTEEDTGAVGGRGSPRDG
jgi:MFS family permease